jgi:hypothetical protein
MSTLSGTATGVTEDRVVVGAEDAESAETTDCDAVACAYASDPRISPVRAPLDNFEKNEPIAVPTLDTSDTIISTRLFDAVFGL